MNSRARASASDTPSATICRTICSAMPQPAEPAPTIATRSSDSFCPRNAQAASSVPSVTAAVPWMSSLKQHMRSR